MYVWRCTSYVGSWTVYVVLRQQAYGCNHLISQRSKTFDGKLEPLGACLVHRFPSHGSGHDVAHSLAQRFKGNGSPGVNVVLDTTVQMESRRRDLVTSA
jgi:hypothetical protein